MIYSRIAGTGSYLPPRVMTNDEFAARLDTTPHKLSEVLNGQIRQTFYDFVNGYRVREVQRRIAAGDVGAGRRDVSGGRRALSRSPPPFLVPTPNQASAKLAFGTPIPGSTCAGPSAEGRTLMSKIAVGM